MSCFKTRSSRTITSCVFKLLYIYILHFVVSFQDKLTYEFTECDSVEGRWRVAFPKQPDSCEASEVPVRQKTCRKYTSIELKGLLFDFRWKVKPNLTSLSLSIAYQMLLKLGYEKLGGTCTNLHTKLADDWIFLKYTLFSTVFVCTFALLWPISWCFDTLEFQGRSNEEGRVSIRETLSQKSEQESDFWVLSFTKYMNSIHDESFFVCV